MINEYQICEKLGEGSYGKVKLVKKKILGFEQKYAVKMFKKNLLKKRIEFHKDELTGKTVMNNALESVKKEIAILKKCNHKNVLKLYEVIENEVEDKMYLILEYAEGGEIIKWNELLGNFSININEYKDQQFLSEEFLRKIFRDCVKGLNYLHENSILHRDLKPGNILMDHEKNGKICDFGLAIFLSRQDVIKTSKGTYQFMSPEAMDEKKIHGGISGKLSDIWSLGVTLFCFVFLELPFNGKNTNELIDIIQKKPLKFPMKRTISTELKDLLTKILEKNAKKRITLEKIITHAWVNQASIPLQEEISNEEERLSITSHDVENAVMPIQRVVFLKTLARKLSKKYSRSNSFSPTRKSGDSEKRDFTLNTNTENPSKNSIGNIESEPSEEESNGEESKSEV